MRPMVWSALLQWSRLGISALVFLAMARVLSLDEIGAFATAFAPVRLLQGVHRPGLVDAGIAAPGHRQALLTLGLASGGVQSAGLLAAGVWMAAPVGPLLCVLAPVPLFTALSAVPEAVLRAEGRLKALALRTMAAQGLASVAAMAALMAGWGSVALAIFVLINAASACFIAVVLVPLPRPSLQGVGAAAAPVWRIAARDLAQGATQPMLQMLLAASLGMSVAGAFQLAARLVGLVDALMVAPMRYVALPRFRAAWVEGDLMRVLTRVWVQSGAIAVPAYAFAALSAPVVLPWVVGPENAAGVVPLVPWYCLLGLLSAVAMPLTQALTAAGAPTLALLRAVAALGLSLGLAVAVLPVGVVAVAAVLPLAYAVSLIPFVPRAMGILEQRAGVPA